MSCIWIRRAIGNAAPRPGLRSRLRASVTVFLAAMAWSGPAAAELALDGPLLSHRAEYDLSLVRAAPGSGIVGVRGMLSFEWADVCDGYSFAQHMRTVASFARGDSDISDSFTAAWEAKDGSRYRFVVRDRIDSRIANEVEGEVERSSEAGAPLARFTKPVRKTVALEAGTKFPTAFGIAVLKAAAAGRIRVLGRVFDGSEPDHEQIVSAVIGRELPAASLPRDHWAALEGQRSWPVHSAFFHADSRESEPRYEVRYRLYENGVAEDFLFDFGDYSLAATLHSLDPIASRDCEQ